MHLPPLRQIKVSVLSLAIMWAPADTGTLHAVTPDDSVDKKRSKHYRRRFVSLACQNEPAAPPRSYLLLEIARVVGLPVGPARARRPPHFGDNNPCRLNGLNGVNGRTEIVDRRKERIIARQLREPR